MQVSSGKLAVAGRYETVCVAMTVISCPTGSSTGSSHNEAWRLDCQTHAPGVEMLKFTSLSTRVTWDVQKIGMCAQVISFQRSTTSPISGANCSRKWIVNMDQYSSFLLMCLFRKNPVTKHNKCKLIKYKVFYRLALHCSYGIMIISIIIVISTNE